MNTLLLRFKAPMQSWGISAKFDRRSTERVPSKSAVIGMLAGALGRKRDMPVDDLSALRFGVRIDKEGRLIRDFQTAKNASDAYISSRYYLADAAFLVGLEGEKDLLETIENALKHPVFPIFLGRRSCPPEGRVVLGIRPDALMNALKAEPWLADDTDRDAKVRFVLDADAGEEESYILRDQPVSFNQRQRKFAFRRVRDLRDYTDNPSQGFEREPNTEIDAMSILEED
ncbi:MAG: type I-E CRISPR-associated protein Cas5/CasD [Proteobacteria bacterium]|nr:type I-E CRISPR-associated protein Cas5/CasD [Pseudomonadota bacterium]